MTDGRVGDIVKRNWGEYEVLAVGERFKVKMLRINPGKATSRQYHERHAEFIFDPRNGGASVEVAYRNQWHQLANDSDQVLELLEIQIGDCEEADIIRQDPRIGGAREI